MNVEHPANKVIDVETRALVERLLFERISMAGIARAVQVSEQWLQDYVNLKAATGDPMTQIPRDNSLDSTLSLLSEGYTFISTRCERYQSDIFATRLMLREAICMMGEEASRMFFQPDRFTRRGAIPPTTLMLLKDRGSVQTMDGEAHRHRKQMFMLLMPSAGVDQLVEQTVHQWQAHLA